MNVPTKETNAQKNTRLANTEKAKVEEKRVKNNLERDLRSTNRVKTSDKLSNKEREAHHKMTTEAEVDLMRTQLEKLKQLEVQYYINLNAKEEIETAKALALLQARTEAARVDTALEEAGLRREELRLLSEQARLLSEQAKIEATNRQIELAAAQTLAARTIAEQTAATAQTTADQAALAAQTLAELTAKRPTQWKLGAGQMNFSGKSSENNTM